MRILYTVLACAGLLLLVPLFVLGATGGDWRHAWHALKEYLRAMAIIVAIGLAFAVPAILGTIFNL
jgi:hypothetical protein